MTEENTIIQDVQQPTVPVEPSRSEERFRQLSEKVELTSKERDELKTLNEQVTRERDFYKGFSDVVATNPSARDHQEDILSKVKSGYTVEDATYAVLGKAGKLGTTVPAPQPIQVAGGSASTAMPQGAAKPASEMTQEERREQLAKDLLIS